MAKSKGGSEATGGLFRREVPKMPEGYYSGDKPNPNLRAFVEAHLREKPYDPEADGYDLTAFDKPIETTKHTAIYNMHGYPSKKPHDAIRQYIAHYTEPGDLVLDPFCGSGGTALAALMEGRKAIAIDRSPAATFIAKCYCTPVGADELETAFGSFENQVGPELEWLYGTRCDRCGGQATIEHTVYSQVFQCPRCMEKVPLYDCLDETVVDRSGKTRSVSACPHCRTKGVIEPISTRTEKYGAVPVLVSYACQAGCRPARGVRAHRDADETKRDYFERFDVARLREIAEEPIPHWYPDAELARAIPYRMLYKKDFRPTDASRLVDLFTKRNLWALSAIRAAALAINDPVARDVVLFALSGIIGGMSRMNRHRPDVSYPTNVLSGMYYLPPISQEEPPLKHLRNKVARLAAGYAAIVDDLQSTTLLVDTRSATTLSDIPANSVDYIFTDPPYAGKVQYGELNFIQEAWLGFDTDWQDEEIIVSEVRGKTEADWADQMRLAMAECYRVLRPGRWVSLCYHDTSEGTWYLVQDIMAEVGFLVDKSDAALFIDTGGGTYNQTQADKATKRDLVINFRKPKPGEVSAQMVLFGDEDETTFREKLHAIVRDHLSANPGSTKDRVYDEVVSRMVRSGQMEAHDFDELLGQIAEPVSGQGVGERWYLREDEETKVDTAETEREDAAARGIAAFIGKRLAAEPGEEGVHYSDLFEHYLYGVPDKPRRQLAEWLPDYFFKTEAGTWRLPASPEEEKAKSDGRRSGVSRRVKRYLSYLRQGLAVPEKHRPTDATLAEWVRHCKLAGMFQEGKLLFETGGLDLDSLSDEAAVEAEEDYQVCVRMLDRQPAEKPKRGRAKKAEAPPTLELDA